MLISISSISAYFEKDMKYHEEPEYYQIIYSNYASACYFKISDFGISGYNYRIKIIGFIGWNANGPADIYVTSKEVWGNNAHQYVPACNPKNNWKGADYGPISWHINNSYPNYDDCNVYDYNWHYSKDVDKFWCIYHFKTESPPYPITDMTQNIVYKIKIIDSLTWMPGEGWDFWSFGIMGHSGNWCMHCVIVYWPDVIESTSLGVVKALFR